MGLVKDEAGIKSVNYLSELFEARLDGKKTKSSIASPRVFVAQLEDGVSGSVLRKITQHIPKPVVVKTIGVDVTNFSKLYRKKHLSGKQTEDLNDLTALWSELITFFDNDETLVNEWINEPIPVLDGACPRDLLPSQYGRDEIREMLDAMKFGDFA